MMKFMAEQSFKTVYRQRMYDLFPREKQANQEIIEQMRRVLK